MKKNLLAKGFTLIELLVVIAILGALSSIVMTATNSVRAKGRDANRIAQLRQISTALEMYYDKYGAYPAMWYTFPAYAEADMPFAWGSMLDSLATEGYVSMNDFNEYDKMATENINDFFNLNIKTAFAMTSGPASPTRIRPQDPLYPTQSYGYMTNTNRSSYRIRAKLEVTSNSALNNGLTGTFYTAGQTTGASACDKSLGYYCLGSDTAAFTPSS